MPVPVQFGRFAWMAYLLRDIYLKDIRAEQSEYHAR